MIFWSRLRHELTRFENDRLDFNVAFRNTVGILLPILFGIFWGSVSAGVIAATGSLIVSYSDGSDPYFYRARRMLSSAVVCALAVILGALTASSPTLNSGLAVMGAFTSGLSVVLGAEFADLTLFSLVMFFLSSGASVESEQALLAGAWTLAGGAMQMVLGLFLWPVRRFRPERRILADLFHRLGALSFDETVAQLTPPATSEMTAAQLALRDLNRGSSDEGTRYRALLTQAERIRLRLVSVGRLQRRLRQCDPTGFTALALESFSRSAAVALQEIAQILARSANDKTDAIIQLEKMQALTQSLRQRLADRETSFITAVERDVLRQLEALAGQLRTSLHIAARSTEIGQADLQTREQKRPWRRRFLGVLVTIRANFSLRSIGFRHAVRLALAVAAAEIFARTLNMHRFYWAPMTAALVLRPEYSATITRAILRVGGTLAGLLITTALVAAFDLSMPSELLILAIFVFVLRSWGTGNYGIFAIAVSGLVVLMSAIAGFEPRELIAARAANTLAGGAMALFVYLLWPTRGEPQVFETLAAMIDSYRRYFSAVMSGYFEENHARPLDPLRLDTRVKRSNFQAALARYLGEPRVDDCLRDIFGSAQASLNQFAHAVMSIEAEAEQTSRPQKAAAAEALRTFVGDVEATLSVLAKSVRYARGQTQAAQPEERRDLRASFESFALALRSESGPSSLVTELDLLTNSVNSLLEKFDARSIRLN